ncbi:MAG: hypothetical protein KDJ36_02675 [Hyphomicrobiaceae bacterium]|nr:hypothetical protein [Hyphomicrobiaceae bacterium]
MRIILLAIALLAVVRFAIFEYLDRTAKQDVIINAYKEHALAACKRQATVTAVTADWSKPASIRLTIGKRDLDVYIWQTRNSLWQARYKNAYLFVTLGRNSAAVYCEYDITNDVASVHSASRPTSETPPERNNG